ncbi:cupin domain-containing protein [Acidimicrobiia bacterium EGI L10123]|uniref:cupin domain-containing protein n=1 Tax=Salinilacustrithrix flava TaxID=2957203 RepID=UPI003D7C16DD|nr:cupin domain-containing protein [Acidimicrobiia bacterium EGI L10123]
MTGWVDDIEKATLENDTFRTVLFTGAHLQMTVMCIQPGEEIGVEKHDDLDQFIRVEQGSGQVQMGSSKDDLSEVRDIEDDWAAIIPGGTWHNVVNTGTEPLRLYSIYTPPEHPEGTVHQTKAEADAAEHDH